MPNIINREAADNDHILDGVRIWLVVNEDGKDVEYRIPIAPEKIDVVDSSNNSSMNILSLGEITVMQKPSLKQISWSSWFPYQDWSPMVTTKNDFHKPSFYVDLIENLRENCKTVRLVVTGIGINCKCTVEQFTWYHKGGDTEDKYYDITLKEYRDYGVLVQQTGILEETPNLGESLSQLQAKAEQPTDFTVGCNVVLNGQLFADSYGGGAGATFTNYACHISLINKDGTKQYHVSDSDGGSLGWVDESSISFAEGKFEGTNHFESTTGSTSSGASSKSTYSGTLKSVAVEKTKIEPAVPIKVGYGVGSYKITNNNGDLVLATKSRSTTIVKNYTKAQSLVEENET